MPHQTIESLLTRLEPQLRRLASRSTCVEVRESADDVINDLFLRLNKHPAPPGYNGESYAVESFKNLVKDRERACRRRLARDVEVTQARPEAASDCPDALASRRDVRWHIKRAVRLANLRPDHRCALWAWLRGSLDDFARRRGIPRKTAGVWAYRARETLRPYLEHLREAGSAIVRIDHSGATP